MADAEPTLRSARANWQAAILVCRKCEKRMGDRGFGPSGRLRLAKALKRTVRKSAAARGLKVKGRLAPVGIVEIGCQKLCPRRGVTVIFGAQPGLWRVAEPGQSTEQLIALAGGDPGAEAVPGAPS